jgi:hypothetical protein
MTRRWWLWFLIAVLGAAAMGVAIDRALVTGQEVASVALSIPILIVATLTLWFTIPKPARLKVESMSEAELTDLIFYVYPEPNQSGQQQIPVDYLLQLHVVVSNLGDRKAVLSAIQLEGFRNAAGAVVHLPDAPETIGGIRWIQQSGWVNSQRHFQNITEPPPYILDRDELIVIRFRARRGIDWGGRWDLDALRSFCEPLRSPIVTAFGTIIWRRAGTVVREAFDVPMQVAQQAEYTALVGLLTHEFTVIPNVPKQQVPLE